MTGQTQVSALSTFKKIPCQKFPMVVLNGGALGEFTSLSTEEWVRGKNVVFAKLQSFLPNMPTRVVKSARRLTWQGASSKRPNGEKVNPADGRQLDSPNCLEARVAQNKWPVPTLSTWVLPETVSPIAANEIVGHWTHSLVPGRDN